VKRARRPDPDASAARIADRLHSVAIHLLRRLRTEDARTGLTGPRASVLSVLVFGGPMTLGALAAVEQVRPPTMTRLVTALERKGLVVRETSPTDARVTLVRATHRGMVLLQEGRGRRIARLQAALQALSARDLESLRDATRVLEEVMPQL
jgi:DNA-binding MarR family transcriptional regulator